MNEKRKFRPHINIGMIGNVGFGKTTMTQAILSAHATLSLAKAEKSEAESKNNEVLVCMPDEKEALHNAEALHNTSSAKGIVIESNHQMYNALDQMIAKEEAEKAKQESLCDKFEKETGVRPKMVMIIKPNPEPFSACDYLPKVDTSFKKAGWNHKHDPGKKSKGFKQAGFKPINKQKSNHRGRR
jgi:hypothetical protein